MLTERTLKRWRKEALMAIHVNVKNELHKRILCMTQELLDLHLIRK